jgi:hypothetical protein
MFVRGLLMLLACFCARGQDSFTPDTAAPNTVAPSATTLPAASVSEKWNYFVSETVTPLTLVAGGLDATVSQMTRSSPLYGKHFWRNDAFLKRFGATLGDEGSVNFFSDFVVASAFHEDTRYVRRGPSHKMWPRIGYAISRAVVTRTDTGTATFNWSNVIGSAMTAGLSNAYYPSRSRTAGVSAVNWGTNVAGGGLTKLAPEFGSDVGHWFKRHLGFHH